MDIMTNGSAPDVVKCKRDHERAFVIINNNISLIIMDLVPNSLENYYN